MKAVVFTLGCKVNECESDSLISGLRARGYDVSETQYRRLQREIGLLRSRWADFFAAGDPFYNANLSLIATDCRLRHPLERRLLAAVFNSDGTPRL